jgi:hypothetical protein
MEQKCIKCNELKPLEMFYKHSAMLNGRVGKCKSCCKLSQKERYVELSKNKEWFSKEKERTRQKYHRLYKGVIKKRSNTKNVNYKNNYPEKRSAQLKCSKIKSINGNNHHWSYNKEHWLDVIDLTKEDHYLLHRHIIYDQERMMYRRVDNGVLLDTKNSHIDLLKELKNV